MNEGSERCQELGGNQFLGLRLGYLDVCWFAAHESIEAAVIVRCVVDGAQVAIGVDERVLAHDLVVLARLLLALDVARVRIIDQPVKLVCHRTRLKVWPQLNGPDGDAAQRQANAEQIAELKDSELGLVLHTPRLLQLTFPIICNVNEFIWLQLENCVRARR